MLDKILSLEFLLIGKSTFAYAASFSYAASQPILNVLSETATRCDL